MLSLIKIFAIRKLVNLKRQDGRSIAEHLSDFQDLVNQLCTMKLVLDDKLQALLLTSFFARYLGDLGGVTT